MEFEPDKETYSEYLERWRQQRGCNRKQLRFHTRKAAKARAKELTLTLRNGRLSAYKCEFCDYFHIGHNWTSQASMRHKADKASNT